MYGDDEANHQIARNFAKNFRGSGFARPSLAVVWSTRAKKIAKFLAVCRFEMDDRPSFVDVHLLVLLLLFW